MRFLKSLALLVGLRLILGFNEMCTIYMSTRETQLQALSHYVHLYAPLDSCLSGFSIYDGIRICDRSIRL